MKLFTEIWERRAEYVVTSKFLIEVKKRIGVPRSLTLAQRQSRTLDAIATLPELLAFAESVRDSFSPSGEYNSHTAELSLRELRQAAVEVLKKAGIRRRR